MQLFGETNIDFIKWSKVAFSISGTLITLSITFLVIRGGLKLGLDFTGGMETNLKFEQPFEISEIRSALVRIGLGEGVIQSYGSSKDNTVRIRYRLETVSEMIASNIVNYRQKKGEFRNLEELKDIPEIGKVGYENLLTKLTLDPKETDKVNLNKVSKEVLVSVIQQVTSHQMATKMEETLKTEFGNRNPFEVLSINFIGPNVGKELQRNAFLAVVLSLIAMLVYIGWRFEFRFAVGAVVALIHDVTITVGALSLGGYEFTLPVLAAVLTIIGYSINDTIVIYDRIRENMKTLRKKKLPSKRILNLSVNQSLSRTTITSLTTVIVVLTLFLWGGEPLHGFAFALLVGIIVGTYSSDFIATPVVYVWAKRKSSV